MITIPSYFNDQKRRLIVDAAELAGLNVLQLVHENTAAATLFGVDRIDKDEDFTVLFYNQGYTDTEVSVVKYSAITEMPANKTYESIEVLSEASIQLGGKDVDNILMTILVERFNALPERKGKADIREYPRIMKRL